MALLRILASRTPVVSAGARRAASSAAIVKYKKFGDLSVHPSLVTFVERDVLPGMPRARRPRCRGSRDHPLTCAHHAAGTSIGPARFWAGLDAIVRGLSPKNAALLARRDALQVRAQPAQHTRPAHRPLASPRNARHSRRSSPRAPDAHPRRSPLTHTAHLDLAAISPAERDRRVARAQPGALRRGRVLQVPPRHRLPHPRRMPPPGPEPQTSRPQTEP